MIPERSIATRELSEAPFNAADRMLAGYLQEAWDEPRAWIQIAAACCGVASRDGNAYFDLASPERFGISIPSWPSIEEWVSLLAESPAVGRENSDLPRPLVFVEPSYLYLEKYYAFEQRLARLIKDRAEEPVPLDEDDPVAAAVAKRFFVITGGPGTGKTTLALRYLDRLHSQWSEERPPRFAAIAPTGKAAARLAESIAGGLERSDFSEERKKQLLSIPCLTIHRLLGALPHRSSFRKDARSPVNFDALVVDESSMIDLPLMMRLFDALPDHCQVLLLGDKDQLSSVEVGSVFSDLLQSADVEDSPLRNSVTRLSNTYRFTEESSIYRICQLSRQGDFEGFQEFLKKPEDDFEFHEISSSSKRIPTRAIEKSLRLFKATRKCSSPEEAIRNLNKRVVLTPTRKGPFGSEIFNATMERSIRTSLGQSKLSTAPLSGIPIMILENDYERELFNGDLGLIWFAQGQTPLAYFPAPEKQVRSVRLSELPRYENAFALTIHKSQGSEFDEALCLFGPIENGKLSRELLYTAFSRAKERLVVFGEPASLAQGVQRAVHRATRLVQLLGREG